MITVKPMREEAIRAGYEAMTGRVTLDYADFRSALEPWEVSAFCRGDEVIGMLLVRGCELHVAIVERERSRWLSRRLIREVVSPIIERHGVAKTSVMPDNIRGRDFVERLGFVKKEQGYELSA